MMARLFVVLGAVTATQLAYGDSRRELTFADALATALAHNGDLYVAEAEIEIAADDIASARSVFDRRLIASARVGRNDELGSPIRFALTDDIATASVGIAGRLNAGTNYTLSFNTTFEKYQSAFTSIYNPAFTNTLTLSVTQPLMRNAGRAANQQPIVVASLRRDLTEQQLRVRLEQVVGAVEVAYWSLAFAHYEVKARQASLKLAEQQVVESKRLVRIGTISDLDVVEAEAGVGRVRRDIIIAEQQVALAEGELRRVIVGDPTWPADEVLVAVDDPKIQPVSMSVAEHIELARKNRPDVIAARAQIGAENAALVATDQELKPQLDLIVSAGLVGFAGTLDTSSGAVPMTFMPDPLANGGVGACR